MWVRKLAPGGKALGPAVPVAVPASPENSYVTSNVAIASTSRGFVLAVESDDGVYLVALGMDLARQWVHKLTDRGYASRPYVVVQAGGPGGHETILALWRRNALGGEPDVAPLKWAGLSADGTTIWPPTTATPNAHVYGRPVATPTGAMPW